MLTELTLIILSDGLFYVTLQEFCTNTDLYSGKGAIMSLKLPNQIKSTSFSS